MLVVTALSLTLATALPPMVETDPATLEALLASVRGQPLQRRILGLSAQLVGTPYAHSPLGEGEGPDPDPRLRLDRVDCLTFVETVMALALSSSVEDVVHVLDSIRYRNRPAYAGRNHLMEAEWLPSNAAKGLVRDVTLELGGDAARAGEKVLAPEAWRSATARTLALPPEAHPVGRFPLSLIPVDAALARAARWPSGTLLLLVREDAPWRITRVSHLGFVVQRGGKTYLRHATRGWKDGVVDEELAHLLGRHARYPWKIAGVSLWEVRDPRPGSDAVSATAP